MLISSFILLFDYICHFITYAWSNENICNLICINFSYAYASYHTKEFKNDMNRVYM